MKNRAKRFKQFLNEAEEPARDEVQDLKRLRELGLVDTEEYINGLIDFASRSGQDPSGLFEPGEVAFSLAQDESLDDEEDWLTLDVTEEMISSWKGPKGEFVVQAGGFVGDEQLNLDLTLSTGAQVHFEWNAYDSRSNDNWILVNGRRSIPYQETMEEIEDDYAEHDDWDTYMHDQLSAVVASSY